MTLSPLAGKPAPKGLLVDLARLEGGAAATFAFMPVDHDGRIRMDPSSSYAMAGLVGFKDQYRLAFANDADRHGIVMPSAGLMNPNHYLAVAIRYLLTHRPHWPAQAAVGKTLVSSSMIDRVVHQLDRQLCEVPAGFKWFAARPSGTEHIYKIYAESFKDEKHLEAIVAEAQGIVDNALQASGPGRR